MNEEKELPIDTIKEICELIVRTEKNLKWTRYNGEYVPANEYVRAIKTFYNMELK
jgi:hypothetical protein